MYRKTSEHWVALEYLYINIRPLLMNKNAIKIQFPDVYPTVNIDENGNTTSLTPLVYEFYASINLVHTYLTIVRNVE